MTKGPIPNLEPILALPTPPKAAGYMRTQLSRGSFIRYAGLGTAGAALFLSRSLDIFSADSLIGPQRAGATPIATSAANNAELGEVTLDGLMMTYFSTPPAVSSS